MRRRRGKALARPQLGPASERWSLPTLPPREPTAQWADQRAEQPGRPEQRWPPLATEDAPGEPQAQLAPEEEVFSKQRRRSPPPFLVEKRWLDSDDALCKEDGSVELRGRSRQTILSADWVHEMHNPAAREWIVHAPKASFDYGDIYFGFTESNHFSKPGRTMLFDVHGNCRYGFHPLQLLYCERRADVERAKMATFSGPYHGDKSDKLRVALDLDAQTMSVRNLRTGCTVSISLPGWPLVSCARLCVSMRTAGDRVAIEDVR